MHYCLFTVIVDFVYSGQIKQEAKLSLG